MAVAEHVDHIQKVKERPDLAFEESNLRSLCALCHNSIKQREELTGTKIGVSIDGIPTDPNHPWRQ